MFTVDHFIQKFSEISQERWGVVGSAMGFCNSGNMFQGKTGYLWPEAGSEQQALNALVWFGLKYESVGDVESGKVKRFKGTTPKERILEALNEIKGRVA